MDFVDSFLVTVQKPCTPQRIILIAKMKIVRVPGRKFVTFMLQKNPSVNCRAWQTTYMQPPFTDGHDILKRGCQSPLRHIGPVFWSKFKQYFVELKKKIRNMAVQYLLSTTLVTLLNVTYIYVMKSLTNQFGGKSAIHNSKLRKHQQGFVIFLENFGER